MAPESSTLINYPDLLGYVTGNVERMNVGVIQAAMAIRPKVVRAGRPFEVLMLLQNAADCPVDVSVVLHLPERDAKRQKGRFIAKVQKLVVGMQPAEVGYIVLPVTTLPDTAMGKDYKITMDLNAKALGKPERIRQPEGGGRVSTPQMRRELVTELENLKKLSFATQKASMLRGTTLEVMFNLISGKTGTVADLKPGWNSLWTISDYNSNSMNLLLRYGDLLIEESLPRLVSAKLLPPIQEKVVELFEQNRYPLSDLESGCIARLLVLLMKLGYYDPTAIEIEISEEDILETPDPEEDNFKIGTIIGDRHFLVSDEEVVLPRWVNGLLRAIAQDKRAAKFPGKAIAMFAFDDLLLDGLFFGLHSIERATGEDLGTMEDKEEFVHQIMLRLKGEKPMDFMHTYLPLVMAGTLIYERVLVGDEKLTQKLAEMLWLLENRKAERNEETEPIFQLAKRTIDLAAMKYGFQNDA